MKNIDNLSSDKFLETLPTKFYVIKLDTKEIIQTNDSEIELGGSTCYKRLFNKELPCSEKDGICICQQFLKNREETEFVVEKEGVKGKTIFKGKAKLISENLVIASYIDISNQVVSKKELKINVKRLERAEKLADFGYWEFNIIDKNIIASEGSRSIYGIQDKVISLDYVQKIVLPEYRSEMDDELDNLIYNNKPYNIQFKIKRKTDGEIRHIHSIAEYREDKQMVFGVIHDITETEVTQAALKESETSFRQLFENMNSAFAFHKIVKDKNGNPVDYIFLNVNSKFETLVGKKREEIIGKSVLSIFPETEEFWIKRYGEVATTGQSINFSDYSSGLDKYFEVAAYSPKADHFAVTFSDITDRIRSEKALNESVRDLKLAQRIAKIGNWQFDPETEKIKFSDQLFYIIGQERKLEFTQFANFKDYLNKADYKQLDDLFDIAIDSGSSFEIQLKIHLTHKNKWVEIICNPEQTKGLAGHVLHGTIQDITESKEAEIELGYSNKLLRTVIDNIPDAIYMKDKNYRKLLANKGDARNCGVKDVNEIIGKSDYDLYPKEVAGIYTEDDRKVIEKGEVIENREEFLPTEGKGKWVLTSKYPLKNEEDEIVGLVGIGRDITELKEQRDKLNLLHQTIEQSPLPIVITDNKGNIEYVNPGFTKASGYAFSEVVGENPRLLKSGHQNPAYYQNLWETIVSGINWSGEFHNKRKDGSLYWESAVITPILNSNKEIKHFVAIKEDITEKKQMIWDLEQAKEKAEESDRLKTMFLANMSHEIRTPLNGILGFSSIICSGIDDDQKLQEFGKIIESSGQRLTSVIDDIIDISMIQSNQLKLSYESFNVNDLLDEMHMIYQNQKSEKIKQLDFSVTYCDNEVHRMIYSDKNRLYQVLKNLLDNAFKFTESGFINFGCLNSSMEELELFVEDTGIGIDESKTEIIFKSFRQADEGNTRKYDGSGLGLAIISGILDKMGGNVSVQSELNKGTRFSVILPRNGADIKKEQKINKPELEKSFVDDSKKRIVSFEDDKASIEYLKIVADMMNYELVNFDYAKEGIEYLKDHQADLVLMDIQLPEMNGYEATRILKANHPELPIIVLTAFAMKGDEEKAYLAGCDDYLPKPLSLRILKEKINQLVK